MLPCPSGGAAAAGAEKVFQPLENWRFPGGLPDCAKSGRFRQGGGGRAEYGAVTFRRGVCSQVDRSKPTKENTPRPHPVGVEAV